MRPRCSVSEILKNMLKAQDHQCKSISWRSWAIKRRIFKMNTFTLSTHSIFSCSGIVVIHSPFEGFKNIPFSAASHMSYSLKFCNSNMLKVYQVVHKEGSNVPRITSSRTVLPLPLSTITVVFGSPQSSVNGCFSSGCTVGSISLYWSPFLSTGSVKVPLNPCSVHQQCQEKLLSKKI